MDQQRLERIARELGRDAADRVDPEVVAERVLQRLRTEPVVRRRPWYRWVALRAAAVAVIAFGTVLAVRTIPAGEQSAGETSEVVPYALEDLSTDELGHVLDSLTAQAPMVEVVRGGFYDLDEEQLEELLASLESE